MYVLDEGKLIQKGTFNELMKSPGIFSELAVLQLLF